MRRKIDLCGPLSDPEMRSFCKICYDHTHLAAPPGGNPDLLDDPSYLEHYCASTRVSSRTTRSRARTPSFLSFLLTLENSPLSPVLSTTNQATGKGNDPGSEGNGRSPKPTMALSKENWGYWELLNKNVL